ncbi:hypothetical protein BC332_26429 [Capsicum chinense]|nr:hypothetical protein BC332_26429 [Capsicum chinense]
MESEGDEASHQHPKRNKPTSSAPFSSTSVQDSSSEFPVLPADLISEILFKLPEVQEIAFSPRIVFLYMYGFGYDELNADCKVVCLTQKVYDDDSRYNVDKIYSLNNNSWKRLDEFRIGKLSNQTEGKLRFEPCLGVLENDLSMLCHHLGSHADVWVMKEYGVKESWTKMFIIKYPYDNMGYSVFGPPFCLSSEGEISFRNDSVFMIYNPNDDSIRFPKVSNFGPLVEATLYIESLVWLFVANGTTNATTSKDTKFTDEDIRVINK